MFREGWCRVERGYGLKRIERRAQEAMKPLGGQKVISRVVFKDVF